MSANDERWVFEAICERLATFVVAPLPFDVHYFGAPFGPVFGRAFIQFDQVRIDQSQEAGSPVHSRVVRQLILKIATPLPGGTDGYIRFADALREHFFPNEEAQDFQATTGGPEAPFVRIETRPELLKSSERSDELTEVAFGFVRGRLGIKFFFEPTV